MTKVNLLLLAALLCEASAAPAKTAAAEGKAPGRSLAMYNDTSRTRSRARARWLSHGRQQQLAGGGTVTMTGADEPPVPAAAWRKGRRGQRAPQATPRTAPLRSTPKGPRMRVSGANLANAVHGLRTEVEQALSESLRVIPQGLTCLEWSFATYATRLRCERVTELIYASGQPYEEFPRTKGKGRGTSRRAARGKCGWAHKVPDVCPSSRLYVDAERLGSFRPAAFSLVISTNVFEHLSRPETAFRSMVASMAPGGWLLLTAPFFEQNHGQPWDFHRYSYHAWYVYARDHSLCIHQIGGHNFINANVYMLSKLVAQKPPCVEPSSVAALTTTGWDNFTSLARANGYALT